MPAHNTSGLAALARLARCAHSPATQQLAAKLLGPAAPAAAWPAAGLAMQQHAQQASGLQQQLQQPAPQQQPPQQPFAASLEALRQGLQLRRAFSSAGNGGRVLQPHALPAAGAAGLLAQQPHQLLQRAGLKQLLPHALAPKPLPRFRKPSKDGRMNRMVIRVPPQVTVQLADGQLQLTGKAGSTALQLAHLDPTGLVAWRCLAQSADAAAAGPGSGSLLLLASPSKRHWRGIQSHVNNAVHGVMQGYLVGLTVQGVGYRMEPVPDAAIASALAARRGEEGAAAGRVARKLIWEAEAEKSNIAYPHKAPARAVRLKVGFTRACIFPLPEGVLAFFVKPSLMYLYGIDKALVSGTAAAIRAVRKPNAYTGNGIQLVGEALRLKQRAGSK